MIDFGVNGRIDGNNICFIATTDRRVNLTGIENHQLQDLQIEIDGGVCS